jgi:integrase
MRRSLRVIDGASTTSFRRPSAIEAAYQHFRLDRQGNLIGTPQLDKYDWLFSELLAWLERERPGVRDFDLFDVALVRAWRVELAGRLNRLGRPYEASTLQTAHVMLKTFLNWAEGEGYAVDARALRLKGIRVPLKEPTVFHIAQLRRVLSACQHPREDLAVRILIGSGVRASELIGLSTVGPDGMPDLMLDSMERRRVELRVRWDAGAKGRKSRRVPITTKLAAAIKRYEARHRGSCRSDTILVNEHGRQFSRSGVQQIMERLGSRVGFHVHAHAFRHTFATVATQLGWNFERLRAAMGHADYQVLMRYVRLSSDRDLGRAADWEEFILSPAALIRR